MDAVLLSSIDLLFDTNGSLSFNESDVMNIGCTTLRSVRVMSDRTILHDILKVDGLFSLFIVIFLFNTMGIPVANTLLSVILILHQLWIDGIDGI